MQDHTVTEEARHAPAEEAPGTSQRSLKRVLLVRHGQTPFNVEGRLPGQLPGVGLTDEGRRQAFQAAVALAGSALTAVVSSPLERASETAQIIARGWGLEVQLDRRLMDTDVGRWAGQRIDELKNADPDWQRFTQDASFTPGGGESLLAVMARAVAVVEDVRRTDLLGHTVVVVAHADVIKLIIAHYQGLDVNRVHRVHVANGSISGLSFNGDSSSSLLALNWTAAPDWLLTSRAQPHVPVEKPAAVDQPDQPAGEPIVPSPAAEPRT